MSKVQQCAEFISLVKERGFEEEFQKRAGFPIDELSPDNFEETFQKCKTLVGPTEKQTEAASTKRRVTDAPSGQESVKPRQSTPKDSGLQMTNFLSPYIGRSVLFKNRRVVSTYYPSCLMLDYQLHHINDSLCENFSFKRENPSYHPYILRMYYGVLFFIQVLRAQERARIIDPEHKEFLTDFLERHPLDQLPVAGPLLPLFETICASQPNDRRFGLVAPKLPELFGPNQRDIMMRDQAVYHYLPNIPGIYGLIYHLTHLNAPEDQHLQAMPRRYKHIPVTADAAAATSIGFANFPVLNARTNFQKISICSPGLQYPCEADHLVNRDFYHNFSVYQFPTYAADNDLSTLPAFLHLGQDKNPWFTVAAKVVGNSCDYISGSGTLADCPDYGIPANQIQCVIQSPATPINVNNFAQSSDPKALVSTDHHLESGGRHYDEATQYMAAYAQTHIRIYPTHPYMNAEQDFRFREGPFWTLSPVYYSEDNLSAEALISRKIGQMTLHKELRPTK